ncbi:NADH-quinone oxidoreductase subunit NuoF [uncultured Maritalea sp.]|uniref:formate dehydrogenase beta subunit n=1 Tax=uncultured Maritalea sp. TaxID=757249 RepID=UPI00260AEDE1|nr:formate dehydrogenase beta subunit [uncultured Maritalea sp.]
MSKQRIFVPLDSAAVALGADDVAAAIVGEAAARNLDIEIVRTGSRGMHWLEPLIEVEVEGQRVGYGPTQQAEVLSLFDASFLEGAGHEKSVGIVENLPFMKDQQRLTFSRCGITDPLSLSDYQAHGGLDGVKRAIKLQQSDIVEVIKTSGLRGRGGAGFPAGIKWDTVQGAQADQKYIVCNADEGDSGTFADRMIMEGDPLLLIEGMVIAGLGVGATKGYIYLRSEYPIAARILNEAIEVAKSNKLLGDDVLGSGIAFHLTVFIGAGAYICGEETSLLESLEGKRGLVRAKPPLPALEGLFGKPTLVHNALSLCAVPWILANGGDAYAKYGQGRSKGTLAFQLAGNIKQGGLFETAFGVKLGDLVNEYGGGTRTGRPFKAVQIGGPLGAYLPEAMLNLPMDYEVMAQNGAGVGHGGIVVFDDTADLMAQARYAFEFCAEESCGKCTPCRVGAVRGEEVIDKIAAGTDYDQNMVLLEDLCELMVDGSLCAMGGMTPIPVMSAVKHFPDDFAPRHVREAAE